MKTIFKNAAFLKKKKIKQQ